MDKILIDSTSTTQWKSLVNEASQACSLTLPEDIESYVVFLLMRFTQSPDIAHKVLGLEFLEGVNEAGSKRSVTLRDVGDQCLLYSGLFPERARRKRVRVSYFINLGRSAYQNLSNIERSTNLFNALSREFVSLMDIMHAMREMHSNIPTLDPITAEEVWQDTGSDHAFQTLQQFTVSCAPICNAHLPKREH